MTMLNTRVSLSGVDPGHAVSSEDTKAVESGVNGFSTRAAENRAGEAASPTLTRREGQTYALVIAGKANKEIAASLGISNRTVKFHVANILRKRGVAGRLELLAKAVARARLATPS